MKTRSIRRFARSVLATSLVAAGTATVALGAPSVSAAAGDLLFSQYMEGSASNKAIEITNISGAPVSLDGYSLELYSNGSATVSNNSDLTGLGTIGVGDVFVLSNSGANADIQAVTDANVSAVNWNGDDAIVLRGPGAEVIDSIGQVGNDPGSEWGDATVGTQNESLCRSSDVTIGDLDPGDAFDPAAEWEPKGQDNIDGLGIPGCELAQVGDLLFSQYMEGSSSNKAIEILNNTGVDISLDGYSLELYSNGSATASTTSDLTGLGAIADGDVFVLSNASANADIQAVTDANVSAVNWNGDDAVVLQGPLGVVDSIGQVGFDPGSEWGDSAIGTQNDTLCRLDTVTSGDTDPSDIFDPSIEWDGKGQDNIDGLGELGCNPPPEAGSVIFSQYFEGSSNNKAIEIANLGSSSVDLSVYSVERYSNGGTSPTEIPLAGTLAAGDVFVLSNTSSNADILAVADLTSGSANWNGDDALVLRDGDGNVADAFGQVGFDPGSAWGSGDTSTVNNTLCRLSSITAGDTDPSDTFDPAVEWEGKGQDNIDGLGTIGCSLEPVGDLIFTQYMEGSSNNKAIEIANFTGAPIELGGYAIEVYANGATAPTGTITPTAGILADGDVFVVANSSADAGIIAVADQTTGSVNWNGDDAVVLRNTAAATVADSIGQVGVDPGSEWGDSTVGTANDTLCRSSDVGSNDGDTNPTDVFDPSLTWTSLGNNSIIGLGLVGCDLPPATVLIHEVQGSGATSPLDGQTVNVEAIVTTLFEDDDALDGFFLQEEDAQADASADTSEGLFVFCRGMCPAALTPGDLVSVTGTVGEFSDTTQITTTQTPTVVSSGNAIPTPATVSLPAPTGTDDAATFESVEGMLTTVVDTLAVSEYFELARFGSLVLTAGGRPYQFTHESMPSAAGLADYQTELAKRQIVLDDGNNDQNETTTPVDEPYAFPEGGLSTTNRFRGGDTITGLTGAMRYSFGQWTITQSPELYDYTFDPANPFPAAPADVGGTLKVANFNVLNFFTTVDVTPSRNDGDCGPSGTLDCRGADSQAEVDRQLAKLTTALAGIDADVVGLVELENTAAANPAGDGTDPVLEAIVNALNASVGAGTYDFIDTGAIGTDAIRVALIYKPATVLPAGAFAILDSSVDARFDDGRNRPMLTQTFDELASGERFTVAVNHLKSKGSGCGAGDDAVDGSGNCNGTRTAAAAAIVDYLAGDPTGSGDPDFLVMGDLNAYRMETPISTLQAGGFVDLIKEFGGDEAYSFVFDSQLGYLDHALANEALAGQVTGVTEWHINADEPSLFDYNDDVLDVGEASFEKKSGSLPLFSVDPARTSDHDPVIIGLALSPPPPPNVVMVVGRVNNAGKPPAGDRPMLALLEELDAVVTLVDDDDLDEFDVGGADLVAISSSVSPRKVGDQLTDLDVPIVSWEAYLFDELGFNEQGKRRNAETRQTQREFEIVDDTHPLAAGLTGEPQVARAKTKFSYSIPEGDVDIVGAVGEGAVLFGYEEGAAMSGDLTAAERRVGLFPSYRTPFTLTADGEAIVLAAFAWALDIETP